ncbi:AAEL003665-PA [Aedes aegypti]|uniref:AAEL003665-PA n=1 Tax=Aedes aegypti TaxID=7159 RepID=Q17EU9_AEDAE|nr:AAEL003665-PA [Aedes aegypti]
MLQRELFGLVHQSDKDPRFSAANMAEEVPSPTVIPFCMGCRETPYTKGLKRLVRPAHNGSQSTQEVSTQDRASSRYHHSGYQYEGLLLLKPIIYNK